MPLLNPQVINVEALNQRTGNDRRLLAILARIFDEYYPRQINQLHLAIRAQDQRQLDSIAQQFKGVLRDLCADSAVGSIEKIEQATRKGQLNDVESEIRCLEREIDQLIQAIDVLCNEN